jgi:hypothetical protein
VAGTHQSRAEMRRPRKTGGWSRSPCTRAAPSVAREADEVASAQARGISCVRHS